MILQRCGISENTNAALSEARGDYIALLDQDDFISTQKTSDAAVLAYEQFIVDQSNNYDFAKQRPMRVRIVGHEPRNAGGGNGSEQGV